jgi:hypothetical protein
MPLSVAPRDKRETLEVETALAEKGVDLDWVRDRVTRASAI